MLLRHLKGVATELPYAKVISVVCEEFGCLPSEAEAELQRDAERDEPLLWDVIDVRAFESTAQTYFDHVKAGTPLDKPSELMVEVVTLDLQLRREQQGIPPAE